ncbi:MAG: hypothetical protein VXW22_10545 [Pseudomonadota bacterium]|nr:hypothetical protein [Pseudomonadota bacterium]
MALHYKKPPYLSAPKTEGTLQRALELFELDGKHILHAGSRAQVPLKKWGNIKSPLINMDGHRYLAKEVAYALHRGEWPPKGETVINRNDDYWDFTAGDVLTEEQLKAEELAFEAQMDAAQHAEDRRTMQEALKPYGVTLRS